MNKVTVQLGLVFLGFLTTSACAQAPDIPVSPTNKSYEYELVTKGIDIPWGMTWLDKDSILVTDRKGELRMIKGGKLLLLFLRCYTRNCM